MSNLNWDNNFQLLQKYYMEYGYFPKQKEIFEGVRLGMWCANQRREINKGRYPANRLEKLQAIGFLKSCTYDTHWERCFQSLLKFLDEFGRFPVEPDVYHGFNIGKWCSNQKLHAKRSNYPQERYDKLNRIGFFDNTREAIWAQHYQLLCDFVDEFQRLPKRTDVYQDFRIGAWCAEQKRSAQKENYPTYRIEKLIAIGLL